VRNAILLVLSILGSFPYLYSQNPFQAFQEVQLALGDIFFLSDNYIAGGAEASVYQSTSAWSSTAKSLDFFEVEASVHVNSLFIPENKRTFTVQNSNFNLVQIQNGESATLPTVLGGETATFFNLDVDGGENEFQALEGVGETQLFNPFLQVSVGLWREIEFTVRYSPDIVVSDIEYGLFGAGLKHSISRYFIKDINSNSLEVALQVAYSQLNSNVLLDPFQVEIQDLGVDSLLSVNQLDIALNSWLFEALVSKRFKNFELFGGVGFVDSNVQFTLLGEQTFALGVLNGLLEEVEPSVNTLKGDLGVNYYFGKFYVSNVFTIGEFANYNISLHYKI